MVEKKITTSGSPGGNSGTASPDPPPVSDGGGMVLPQSMNTAVERSLGGGGGNVDLSGKKKRGRPKKYDSNGNLRISYISSPKPVLPPPPSFSMPPQSSGFAFKRGPGRPPGSRNRKLSISRGELFAKMTGGDFTPHVMTVNTGEDVAAKLHSFSQKGPRGTCILSANGAVSNVAFHQPGSSSSILTYEGRFEIVSLCGSFTASENGGMRNRTGGLSVSLAGPDGRVIGGSVAGLLMAAGPIQIVIGSFMSKCYKKYKIKHHHEPRVAPVTPSAPDTVTKPISLPTPNGHISLSPTPQFKAQSQGEDDNVTSDKQKPNSTVIITPDRNGSGPKSGHRPSPDIIVSVG